MLSFWHRLTQVLRAKWPLDSITSWLIINSVMVACPSHCISCAYDTTLGKTMCADDMCEDGYAISDNGGCGGLICHLQHLNKFLLTRSNSHSVFVLYLLLTISLRPVIPTSVGLIFAKFLGLTELWL